MRPFDSFFSVIFGRFKGRAGPGGGGVFCCDQIGEAANAKTMDAIMSFILVPFVWMPLNLTDRSESSAQALGQ